jgi:hypothetical protein
VSNESHFEGFSNLRVQQKASARPSQGSQKPASRSYDLAPWHPSSRMRPGSFLQLLTAPPRDIFLSNISSLFCALLESTSSAVYTYRTELFCGECRSARPVSLSKANPAQIAIRSSWPCMHPLRVVVKSLAVLPMFPRYFLDQFTTKWFSPSQQYRRRRAEQTIGSLVEFVSHVCGLLCAFTMKE